MGVAKSTKFDKAWTDTQSNDLKIQCALVNDLFYFNFVSVRQCVFFQSHC